MDHVNGHVSGSITQKKYMRNEIWSLISYFGALSWFITFSPADNMHPISFYFADAQETFSPELRPDNECYRLIAENPVAGAQFFHFIVEISRILRRSRIYKFCSRGNLMCYAIKFRDF